MVLCLVRCTLSKTKIFFDRYRFIDIWYVDGTKYRYEIVSAYRINNEHIFSHYDVTTKEKRHDYFDNLGRQAGTAGGFYRQIDTDNELKIIALSTCNSPYDDNRFVVHAVLVKEVKIR